MRGFLPIFLLVSLAGCATVEQPAVTRVVRECAGPEWEWATYKARVETALKTRWIEFGTRERDSFLRSMNRASPASGYMYDRVGFFRLPGQQRAVLLVYIVDDCVWGNGMTSEAEVMAMIGSGTEARN